MSSLRNKMQKDKNRGPGTNWVFWWKLGHTNSFRHDWATEQWGDIKDVSRKNSYYVFFKLTNIIHGFGCYCSVARLCLTLCDAMDFSTPDFPVLHHLLEFSHSCPLSGWCHPIILSSVLPFSCLQSFLVSGPFPTSCLLVSGVQNIGASASTPVLPMNIQSLFSLQLTGLIFLSEGISKVFSSTTVWRHQ